jgi:catechol 2,3-dioxygenase-like lactoylglutathione lyase family enzyme
VEQRISLITLGVRDVEVAKAFYERLGWRVGLDVEQTVFFQVGQTVLTLWNREELAEDSGVIDSGGSGGVTLAHNVRSLEDVEPVIDEARAAGALIAREPAETFYGGYAGVFVDPDGHPWEVAYNPNFALRDDGALILPQE